MNKKFLIIFGIIISLMLIALLYYFFHYSRNSFSVDGELIKEQIVNVSGNHRLLRTYRIKNRKKVLYLFNQNKEYLSKLDIEFSPNTTINVSDKISYKNKMILDFLTEDEEWKASYIWDINNNSFSFGSVKKSTGKQFLSKNIERDKLIKSIITQYTKRITEEILSKIEVKIKYSIEENKDNNTKKLVAYVNGKRKILVEEDEENNVFTMFLFITTIEDIDNNLVDEVIYTLGQANSVPSDYYLISYDKIKKEFRQPEYIASSFNDPFIEKKGSQKIIVSVVDNYYLNDEMGKTTTKFLFQDGNLSKIQEYKAEIIQAVKEIQVRDFKNTDDIKKIYFDINDDGITDEISCEQSPRWNELNYEIKINGNNETLLKLPSSKRIGILASKTNEYHDIVLHIDYIYKWDGYKYNYSPR